MLANLQRTEIKEAVNSQCTDLQIHIVMFTYGAMFVLHGRTALKVKKTRFELLNYLSFFV